MIQQSNDALWVQDVATPTEAQDASTIKNYWPRCRILRRRHQRQQVCHTKKDRLMHTDILREQLTHQISPKIPRLEGQRWILHKLI